MNSLAAPETTFQSAQPEPSFHYYQLYGLCIRTQLKLTLDDTECDGSADVEIIPGDDHFLEAQSQTTLDPNDWIHWHELEDGWTYLRYDALFEFLVAPLGDRIYYRFLNPVPLESFQTYVLGRVFSFALVKMGYEPLHAATVVVDGKAIAFLGASTFGKSSLAACFIASGYPLLTDDTLRLEERDGKYFAFPGPPRLRLLPRVGRLYLGDVKDAAIMNPREADAKAPKLVFCLSHEKSFQEVAPLAAVYVITAPRKVHRRQKIMIDRLSPLESVMHVVSFTHNTELSTSERLTRQLDAAQRLVLSVPIRALSYPRVLASLDDVKELILGDLKNHVHTF